MSCDVHGNNCAFPDREVSRCPYCHASWSKITAPATRVTERRATAPAGRGLPSRQVTVTDISYLSGYGEYPLNHLWRHAVARARGEKA